MRAIVARTISPREETSSRIMNINCLLGKALHVSALQEGPIFAIFASHCTSHSILLLNRIALLSVLDLRGWISDSFSDFLNGAE